MNPKDGNFYMEMGPGYWIAANAPSTEVMARWFLWYASWLETINAHDPVLQFKTQTKAALKSGGWWLT